MITGLAAGTRVAGGGWRVAGTGQKVGVRIVHRDLDLKNYQRHDYQNLRRGEQ
jgi:hypothetical protein